MNELQSRTLLQGGKYRIEKPLGQGGFGITYLAEQTLMERKVCIKEFFMKEYCDRDEATSQVSLGTQNNAAMMQKYQEKFLKEARMIARLDHPNIIRIFDVFTENNTAYYVMEYIEGKSLNEMVKEGGALPEEAAVEYIRQIGEGLAYVHKRNINHLDIKPGNILIRKSDNRPILIDFGMSKQYDEVGEQTSSTPLGVSAGYAPLEMYQSGGVSAFSPQTDIYELGATLYRLVTGEVPPSASDVMNEGLPKMPSGVSTATRVAIEKAMEFRKKDRPESVSLFLSLLDTVKEKVPENDATVLVNPLPKSDESELTYTDNHSNSEPQNAKKTDIHVTGQVMDTSHHPIAGVYIVVKGTTFGTSSDLKGRFSLNVPENSILEFVCVGFITQSVSLEGRSFIGVILVGDPNHNIVSSKGRTSLNNSDKESTDVISSVSAIAASGILNGHGWVDLGLPSGLKWATCNVGAGKPEDYGDYFAWGETRHKSEYSWENYTHRSHDTIQNTGLRFSRFLKGSLAEAFLCFDSSTLMDGHIKFSNYNTENGRGRVDNKVRLELSDDAARVVWGGTWRMPTRGEFQELFANCSWTITTQGGQKGVKVTSKVNDNSIFLPAAGMHDDSGLICAGSRLKYWSSSLERKDPINAFGVSIWIDPTNLIYPTRAKSIGGTLRFYGLSIRPVTK